MKRRLTEICMLEPALSAASLPVTFPCSRSQILFFSFLVLLQTEDTPCFLTSILASTKALISYIDSLTEDNKALVYPEIFTLRTQLLTELQQICEGFPLQQMPSPLPPTTFDAIFQTTTSDVGLAQSLCTTNPPTKYRAWLKLCSNFYFLLIAL